MVPSPNGRGSLNWRLCPDAERPREPLGPRTRHRKRLAEAEEQPRGRRAKEPREAWRRAVGLPPYGGDDAESCRPTRRTNR
jgi:hypothetical protein